MSLFHTVHCRDECTSIPQEDHKERQIVLPVPKTLAKSEQQIARLVLVVS